MLERIPWMSVFRAVSRMAALLSMMMVAWPGVGHAQVLGPETRITQTPGAHDFEPTIAASGNTVVAVWSLGGTTRWSASLDGGVTWSVGASFPRRSTIDRINDGPTVCATAEGRFFAAVKYVDYVNQVLTTEVWRGDLIAGVMTWSLPRTALVPTSLRIALLQYMPSLAYDDASGVLYLAATEPDRVGDPYDYQARIVFTRSLDQGMTWSPSLMLSSQESAGGRVVTGPNGEVYVVWEDYGQRAILMRRSLDQGMTFEPAIVVAPINDNLTGGPPFYWPRLDVDRANPYYDACSFQLTPNRPAIAVDRSSGPFRGRIYVSWAEMASGVLSTAGPPMPNHEPNNGYYQAQLLSIGQTVEGYVFPEERGGVDRDYFAFDGVRAQTIVLESEVMYLSPQPPPWVNARCFSMGAVCDTTYGGRNIIIMREEWRGPLPPLVMTLPKSGRYFFRVGAEPPYVSGYRWRLRELAVSPTSVARDQRDIAMVISSDAGQSWSAPRRVNDDPPWHDNSFPQLAVDGTGGVHCAWYDRRHDTECDRTAMTYWALSRDGGQSFPASGPVSRIPSDWSESSESSNIGDGFGLAVSGETVHLAWTQSPATPDQQYNIHAVSLTPPSVSVGLSGFMARVENGRAVLAWQVTEADDVVGCRVERSDGESMGSFVELGESLVVPDEGGHCRFVDGQARLDGEYDYRIRVVSRGGESEVFGPFHVRWAAPGRQPTMGPMVPNPFAGSVRTTIQLPEAMTLEITVFDVLGRRVRSVQRGLMEAGEHEVTWDGSDDLGAALAPGNYFVRMTTEGGVVTRKVTLRR